MSPVPPGKRGQAGFTLMEILIAMAVLMVGLIPMLAVFRTALFNLNRSIEDTYASAIAQSVFDAIRVGMKDMKYELADGTKFFILDHDGSEHLEQDRKTILKDADLTQAGTAANVLARDYAILLPKYTETEPPPPGRSGTPIGKAFLYPRENAGDNQARRAARNVSVRMTGADGSQFDASKLEIKKVYQLGRSLANSTQEVEKNDAYPQYSFAFSIRAAKSQNPSAPNYQSEGQDTIPGLYEVTVKIFRNFVSDPKSKRNDPVGGREFVSLVSE